MTAYDGLLITSHILAFLGFSALGMTGNTGTTLFVSSTFAVLLSIYSHYGKREIYIPPKLTTPAGIAVILYLAASYLFLGRELFVVLVNFLVLVQIIKLLSRKNVSDYRQIIILSFFQFLSVTVSTTNVYYGVITLVYILLTTAAMILHTICSGSEQSSLRDDDRIDCTSFVQVLVPAFLLTIIFTTLIFISMPRFRKSFISTSLAETSRLESGFSDQINLGQVGEIKKDSTPVMTVKVLTPGFKGELAELYWRGITHSDFDGSSWRINKQKKNILYEDSNGIIHLSQDRKENLIKQEIITEPLDTDVLFAADTPVAYQDIPYNRIKEVSSTHFMYGSVTSNIKYIAYSELSKGHPENNTDINYEYPVHIREKYINNAYSTNGIKKLAGELFEQQNGPFRNALKTGEYLRNNFNYSRTIEYSGKGFPLDEFLFGDREGHCEYFATSMVVLLRNMGIPARLVTGFLGGDYNDKGDFYVVRESHAHAWVEVYFNSDGWIRFDPTPPDSSPGSNDSFLSSYLEFMKYRWNRYIVDFDSADQKMLLKSFRDKVGKTSFNFPDIKGGSNLLYATIAGVIAVTALLYFLFTRLGPSFIPVRHSELGKASQMYMESLETMKKRGIEKTPATTPKEFCAAVSLYRPKDSALFRDFTYIYLETRFSRHKRDRSLIRMKELLKEIRKQPGSG